MTVDSRLRGRGFRFLGSMVIAASIATSFSGHSAIAQNATPDASPTAGSTCIQGRWRVTDIGTYIEQSFTGMFGVTKLTYQEATGEFIFSYLPGGVETIEAVDYRLELDAKVKVVGTVNASVRANGRAIANYSVTGDIVTVSGTNRDNFSAEVKFPFGTFDVDLEAFLADGTSRFVCTDRTLVIYPNPAEDLSISYERLPESATPVPSS